MKMRAIRKIRMKNQRQSRVGKRCYDYYPGCAVCESYKFLDNFGRFPYTYDELCDWTNRND